MRTQWTSLAVAMALFAAVGSAQATLNPIALNYNWNGIVHASESGSPDAASGYRSISDRGLDFTGGVPSDPTLDTYTLVSSAGVLDIVHLGNNRVFDATVDANNVGVQPSWLVDPDQTTPQTTTLADPIRIEAGSYAGVVYQISNGGGDFDVRFSFTDGGPDYVATLSGPDWFGPFLPTPAIDYFPGTDGTDAGNAGATLALTEGIIDLSGEAGRALSGITFENQSNTGAGYAIVAMNVEGGDCSVLDCSGGACCIPGTGCSDEADEAACDGLGGAYQGDATICATANCSTGACCNSGSCTETVESACVSGGGVYVGGGTTCFSGVCAGGCCDGGFCFDGLTEATCNGIYLGDATFCFDLTTPCNDDCIGATPVIDGQLFDDNSSAGADQVEASCDGGSDHDIWYSYDASCEGLVTIDTEGSSDPNLDDTVLAVFDTCGGNEIACDDDSGTGFLSSLSFASSMGTTYYIRVAGAGADAGLFVMNIDCIDTGACCNADLSCSDGVNEATCTGAGGVFNGINSTCAESICSGACCAADGACTQTINEEACALGGGYYSGDGLACEDSPCEIGPCCLDDGNTCTNLIEDACIDMGGTWFGPSGLTDVKTTSIVEVSSHQNPAILAPENIINGSGLSGVGSIFTQTHGNGNPVGGGANIFWHSCEHVGDCGLGTDYGPPDASPDDVFVTIDLGAEYDLDSMLVWNFNASYNFGGGDMFETDRGIQQYDLLVAGDGIDPTNPAMYTAAITDGIFAQATGTNAEPAQSIALNLTGIRYVRIEADSNYGGTVTGLSEVRFIYDAPDCSGFTCPTTGACCSGGTCSETAPSACGGPGYVCDQVALGSTGCLGDADLSGVVNASDRGFVSANIGISEADVGTLFATLTDFYDALCSTDMDCSGVVNASDRGFVSANIGLCTPLPPCQDGSGLNPAGSGPDPRFPASAGTFRGLGTTCADVVCTGACCTEDGACTDGAPEDCEGIFLGFGSECSTAQCPLFNDDCDGAFTANDGPNEYTTVGATLDATAPTPSDGNMTEDVWFQWTANCIGDVLIDTCDSSTANDNVGGDSVLEVYRGCDCGDLESVGVGDDDGCGVSGFASIVAFQNTANASQCYTIRISGWNGGDVNSLLTVDCSPLPQAACCDGESCSVTYEFECGGTWLSTIPDCTGNPCATGACCVPDAPFCITGVTQMECENDFSGTYQGDASECAGQCPTRGACCDDGVCTDDVMPENCAGIYQGDATLCADTDCSGGCCFSGSCTDGFTESTCAGNYLGDQTLCSEVPACPPDNDDCDLATTVTDGQTPYTTVLATLDPTAPSPSDGNMTEDVWFQYTANCVGTLDVNTCDGAVMGDNTGGDSVLEVYAGCDCGGLQSVGVGDDSGCGGSGFASIVNADNTTAGRCYTIRISGWNGGDVNSLLDVSCTPYPEAACCDGGSCSITREFECAGTWLSDVTSCSDSPCTSGSCCSSDGSTCADSFESQCADSWFSGESCGSFSCPTMGACCNDDGTCTVTDYLSCTGVWNGVGSTCGGVDCSPLNNIALNYNYNGVVHATEFGTPDDLDGYRSISDRGLDFILGPPSNAIVDKYSFITTPDTLDIVYIGNRNTVDGGGRMFDAAVNADDYGVLPNWLADPDQTGPQTTALPGGGMLLDTSSEAGVIFQISNGGGNFDVRFTFSSGPDVVVTLNGPDWYGPSFGQPNIGAYPGTGGVDSASPSESLLLTEGKVDLSGEAGRTLVSITFENRSNANAGYAILATNVRGTVLP